RLGSSMTDEMKSKYIKSELGEDYIYYQQVKNLSKMMRTPQMRMPYDISIH
ncbi:MAG: hypothetical protein JSU01_12110, partial [Bacteroidetes bacterium]|nr:hypothetical protein [Bacteroidota bacterium]